MIEKQYFIAGLTIFCIYTFITFLSIVSYLKRELYIFPLALCAVQFVMLATSYNDYFLYYDCCDIQNQRFLKL